MSYGVVRRSCDADDEREVIVTVAVRQRLERTFKSCNAYLNNTHVCGNLEFGINSLASVGKDVVCKVSGYVLLLFKPCFIRTG